MAEKKYFTYTKYASLATSFAATILGSIFFFFVIGKWLDNKWGTAPYLMLVGIFLGLIVGLYSLFKELMAIMSQEEKDKSDKNE